MNFTNITIGRRIKIGSISILILVIMLGLVAYYQTYKIHQQTETLYEHPLKVRRALGELTQAIFLMKIDFLMLSGNTDSHSRENLIQNLTYNNVVARGQIDTLYSAFLGPQSYIDSAKATLTYWIEEGMSSSRDGLAQNQSTPHLVQSQEAHLYNGAANTLAHIKKISDFALAKSYQLFDQSRRERDTLAIQLIALVFFILVLASVINNGLLNSMRTPLAEILCAAKAFRKKNYSARSKYASRNEFGELSEAFNSLVTTIEEVLTLNEKIALISGVMIHEDDPHHFFYSTLKTLMEITTSQMASLYLLSEDKKCFEQCTSIGLDQTLPVSFLAHEQEGEFGCALATQTVTVLSAIPESTRFMYKSVYGTIVPSGIITIPVVASKEVVAIISLACVNTYSTEAVSFINAVLNTLTARFISILSTKKNQALTNILKIQNMELLAQKSELTAQSTELAEQNRELEAQKKQLDDAGKLKTSFLSNMSHELRTPLNSVIALSGVLHRKCRGKLPPEEYAYLEVIERNGRMLLALINDILDLSRIESGKEELDLNAFTAQEIVNETIQMLKPQADEHSIEMVTEFPTEPLTLVNDAHKIQHILQNILANAIKFTEKGSITSSITTTSEQIIISIKDTGIGIHPDHISFIFDEFRQADGSTSRRYGGTGLGLAIAKKYACLVGGDISVTSILGEGSTFSVFLPKSISPGVQQNVQISSQKNRIPSQSLKPTSPPSETTILVVDDSNPALIQLQDILSEEGYTVLIATGGEEALSIIEKTIPHAIILDLMMPDIDGFEVLGTIREADRTAHVPVLILTAKQITQEELNFLTRNNIHQLIQKGDINRTELCLAIQSMTHQSIPMPKPIKKQRLFSSKPTLLIVEDNPDNLLTMNALLSDNFMLITATNGQKGIDLAEQKLPDIILMDISLGGMDGITAFKTIRGKQNTAHIPIIAVTANAMLHDKEMILALGFDGYVPKPIETTTLFDTLQEALYDL